MGCKEVLVFFEERIYHIVSMCNQKIAKKFHQTKTKTSNNFPKKPSPTEVKMFSRSANLFFVTCFAIALPLQSSFSFDWSFTKRSNLHIVGSSTISPFMAAVSEEFSRNQNLKKLPDQLPVVESDGTRDGFRLFCAGVGTKYPDFVDASRPIEKGEIEKCHQNGVKEIVEIKIGYDGIVIGNFVGSKKIKLTKKQIFLALAQEIYDQKSGKMVNNPYSSWNEIDASLPKTAIKVYGPPLTSGTRDVFIDMLMEDVCFNQKDFVKTYPDHIFRKERCSAIRRDGRFIESGENDDLIVENLKNNPDAFGILGFNFVVANRDVIQVAQINNVEPTASTIASKQYGLSRPLFVYFKKEHLNLMPEMRNFIKEIIDTDTIGKNGYLVQGGLVALSDAELDQIRKDILSQL